MATPVATPGDGRAAETIEGMATTTTPRVGDRVMITMGRWQHRTGRLVSVTATDAVVELTEQAVTVAPSMIVVMGR